MKLTSFLFSQKEHQPDEFFYKELGIAKYQELSYLVRIILILSHNQAAVERGFNHNNYVLQPSMTPNTIISKLLIKDHTLAHRFELHTIEITKPMIKFLGQLASNMKFTWKKKRNSRRRMMQKGEPNLLLLAEELS